MTDLEQPERRPRRRRRVPRLLWLVGALAVTAGLWTAFAPSGQAGDNTASANAYAIQAGRDLFLRGCASCHGLQAQGQLNAPSLIGVGAAAVDFQVSTGRMPLGHPGAESEQHRQIYTPTQIAQLAAYVASLAPGPKIPDTAGVATADIAAGGVLFRADCAQCHNSSGSGGALVGGAFAPSLRGLDARIIEEAMITGPEQMPVFGPGQLTHEQKNEVAAYVIALRHTGNPGGDSLGRIGPVPEGAVGWIGGIGGCTLAALFVATRRRAKR